MKVIIFTIAIFCNAFHISSQSLNKMLKDGGAWHLGMSKSDFEEDLIMKVYVKLDQTDSDQKKYYQKLQEAWRTEKYDHGFSFDDAQSHFRNAYVGCPHNASYHGDLSHVADKVHRYTNWKNAVLRKDIFKIDYNITRIPKEITNVIQGSEMQKLSRIGFNSNKVIDEIQLHFYFPLEFDPYAAIKSLQTIDPTIPDHRSTDTERRVVRWLTNKSEGEEVTFDFYRGGGECNNYWILHITVKSI